ncbi:MAG: hypothetical protein WBX38_01555 [Candidatus Sulfotelmatobacter sp.]
MRREESARREMASPIAENNAAQTTPDSAEFSAETLRLAIWRPDTVRRFPRNYRHAP